MSHRQHDIEAKYYADGEDAYDMRKPLKDVEMSSSITDLLLELNVTGTSEEVSCTSQTV